LVERWEVREASWWERRVNEVVREGLRGGGVVSEGSGIEKTEEEGSRLGAVFGERIKCLILMPRGELFHELKRASVLVVMNSKTRTCFSAAEDHSYLVKKAATAPRRRAATTIYDLFLGLHHFCSPLPCFEQIAPPRCLFSGLSTKHKQQHRTALYHFLSHTSVSHD